MCGSCSSLPFALLLITNSNYTRRQKTDRQRRNSCLACSRPGTKPEENRWRTGGESSFQYRNRRTRGPESKGNRRTRLATDPPTVCRPSFAAHFITMPLYSNPIIKRKTLGEWAEKGSGGRTSCLQHVSTFALGKHKLPTQTHTYTHWRGDCVPSATLHKIITNTSAGTGALVVHSKKIEIPCTNLM